MYIVLYIARNLFSYHSNSPITTITSILKRKNLINIAFYLYICGTRCDGLFRDITYEDNQALLDGAFFCLDNL